MSPDPAPALSVVATPGISSPDCFINSDTPRARLTPPVDLVKEFALPVPSLVMCELLGVLYADREDFQVNSARFMVKDLPLDEKMVAYGALATYLSDLVTRKRAAPGEDILSDLARHDDLTIEELTGSAFLPLLAGHETTAHRFPAQKPAQPYLPDSRRVLRRPRDRVLRPAIVLLAPVRPESTSIGVRRAAVQRRRCPRGVGSGGVRGSGRVGVR